MISPEDIRHCLALRPPRLINDSSKNPASVALTLCGEEPLQLLFIERSAHPKDPWSGNLAFPGGRIDAADSNARAAAERETREELGLDLRSGRMLGRLDDIAGAHLPVRIACFVYHLPESPPLHLNHEVTRAFWFPLEELVAPERHLEVDLHWQGKPRKVKAIRLLEPNRPVLWGITYRLVVQLLARLQLIDTELTQVVDD